MLATFALGTAAGDLTAISLNLGFFDSVLLFAAIIAIPAIGWWRFNMNPILAFWFAYIVTRPLGASFADWFSKPTNGGLGLGDGTVSAIALIVFIALVAYVAITKCDVQGEAACRARRTTVKPRAGSRHRVRVGAKMTAGDAGPTSAIRFVANRQYGRMNDSAQEPASTWLTGRAERLSRLSASSSVRDRSRDLPRHGGVEHRGLGDPASPRHARRDLLRRPVRPVARCVA